MKLETRMQGVERVPVVEVDFGEANPKKFQGLKAALVARGVPKETVEDVIAGHAIANMKVSVRALVKTGMTSSDKKAALSDMELQEKVNKWIPQVPEEREAVSTEKKLEGTLKGFEKLSAEEQAAYIAKLQARMSGK